VNTTAPDALTAAANLIDYMLLFSLTLTALLSQRRDFRLKAQAIFLSETKHSFDQTQKVSDRS
jgi:hypothetical protein